jgi:hypothetical protein
MCTQRTRRVFLWLLLAVVCTATVDAKPILTATCADPQGSEMSYGSGLLELGDLRVETWMMEYPGAHPVFLIDDAQPNRMLITWGYPPSVAELGGDQVQTYEATILLTTERQITAVRQLAATVWMYSLFPKLGMVYFSIHRHFPLGDVGSSLSLHALCQFTGDGK